MSRTSEYEAPRLTTYGNLEGLTNNKQLPGSSSEQTQPFKTILADEHPEETGDERLRKMLEEEATLFRGLSQTEQEHYLHDNDGVDPENALRDFYAKHGEGNSVSSGGEESYK